MTNRMFTKKTLTSKSWAVSFPSISALFILLVFLSINSGRNIIAAFSFVGHVPALSHNKKESLIQRQGCQRDRRRQRQQAAFRLHLKANARHDYMLEANSDPTINSVCTFTEEQIHLLIAKRLKCKKSRNFADADKILKALNKNGIFLQDKQRKYRVDGANHFGRRKRYAQRGGNFGLSAPEDLAVVEELVEERARYKRQRDYYRSDEITDLLKERYGVKVDDRRREWRFVDRGSSIREEGSNTTPKHDLESTEWYVPTPLAAPDHTTHTMSEQDKQAIRNRLKERSIARSNKKYKEADQIRDELMQEYSILIDDRTKEWKVIDDDDGYGNDAFAREAQLSQRSAFVRTSRGTPVDGTINTVWDDDDADDTLDQELSRIVSTNNVDAHVAPALSSLDPMGEETRRATRNELPTSGETLDGLRELTVTALKEKLRMAGLPVSGRKSELIDRLVTTYSNE